MMSAVVHATTMASVVPLTPDAETAMDGSERDGSRPDWPRSAIRRRPGPAGPRRPTAPSDARARDRRSGRRSTERQSATLTGTATGTIAMQRCQARRALSCRRHASSTMPTPITAPPAAACHRPSGAASASPAVITIAPASSASSDHAQGCRLSATSHVVGADCQEMRGPDTRRPLSPPQGSSQAPRARPWLSRPCPRMWSES